MYELIVVLILINQALKMKKYILITSISFLSIYSCKKDPEIVEKYEREKDSLINLDSEQNKSKEEEMMKARSMMNGKNDAKKYSLRRDSWKRRDMMRENALF